jgi:hypothetical protein
VKGRGAGAGGVRPRRAGCKTEKIEVVSEAQSCKTSSSSREKFILSVKKLKQQSECNFLHNIRGRTIKFENSSPCACHGSTGQNP